MSKITDEENAELKKELDSYKSLDSHYDEIEEDAKRIAEENETLTKRILELQQTCGTLTDMVDKLKCCGNCTHYHKNETIRVGNNVLCRNGKNQTLKESCLEWEMAE